MKRKPKTHLAPREVRTHAEHLRLRRDNYSTKNAWILIGGDGTGRVTIAEQTTGERAKAMVHLTPRQLDQIIAWWQKPQRLTKPPKEA